MSTIHEVSGYETSRDYEWLADQMPKRSVVCIVNYRGFDRDAEPLRDIAKTIWNPSSHKGEDGIWQLSARGICYIYESTRAEFIKACKGGDVEILVCDRELKSSGS